MTQFTTGQFVEWGSGTAEDPRRVGEYRGTDGSFCRIRLLGRHVADEQVVIRLTSLRPWTPIPGELCSGKWWKDDRVTIIGKFVGFRTDGDACVAMENGEGKDLRPDSLRPLAAPPTPAPAVEMYMVQPDPLPATLPDGALDDDGWMHFGVRLRSDGPFYDYKRAEHVEGAKAPAGCVAASKLQWGLIPKPAPPPPIADGDRLHGPSPNHCSLCGNSYSDVERHCVVFNVAEGKHSVCEPCSVQHHGGASTEVKRRFEKLLAKDSPARSGSVDAAHRETAVGSAPASPQHSSTQPSEPAISTPKIVHAYTVHYSEPDPYQNFPHGMNDAQVAVAMSAIDARRSRHKAEVLRDMSRDVRTWPDKMTGERVSFWGKKC